VPLGRYDITTKGGSARPPGNWDIFLVVLCFVEDLWNVRADFVESRVSRPLNIILTQYELSIFDLARQLSENT